MLHSLSAILIRPDVKPRPRREIVVVGLESVGKSQLISSLTNCRPYIANYYGSTVSCECYYAGEFNFVDTPGIQYLSDSATTRQAIARINTAGAVLLVVKSTNIDQELALLMPLVRGKNAAIVITFRDKLVRNQQVFSLLKKLQRILGLPIKCVDARQLTEAQRKQIFDLLRSPREVEERHLKASLGWCAPIEHGWLKSTTHGRMVAGIGLILPAVTAVATANQVAELIDPQIQAALGPLIENLRGAQEPLRTVLTGKYGLITMGPLLFVWALPTVIIYALLLGIYKASGILDLLTVAIDPVIRPFGLVGRDLVRVLMGFGCNVPAVISTRACSACSRDSCISAIAFGSACSYQMGATLAVFTATGHGWLVGPYLLYLMITTFIYVRLISSPAARSPTNSSAIDGQIFLQVPKMATVWRDSENTIRHFLRKAMPVFVAIAVLASLLDWAGFILWAGSWLEPVMVAFNLPPSAVLPIFLASIRKDGILLLGEPSTAATLNAAQVLTVTYLAGVLLPCLVTTITVATERSVRLALRLVARQMAAAILFSLILAWIAQLVSRLG